MQLPALVAVWFDEAMRKRVGDGNGQQEYDMEQTHLLKKNGATLSARPVTGADVAARCRWQLGCVVGVILLLLPLVQQHLGPPEVVWKAALATSLAFLTYKILTFKRWADEYPYVSRFLVCIAAMVVELLCENVMVWIVSATDIHKYDDPPALQDNGEILFNYLAGVLGLRFVVLVCVHMNEPCALSQVQLVQQHNIGRSCWHLHCSSKVASFHYGAVGGLMCLTHLCFLHHHFDYCAVRGNLPTFSMSRGHRKKWHFGLVHQLQVVEHHALPGLCPVSCFQCCMGPGMTNVVLMI
eukprot:GHUV01027551.1.p1 GENE.GHUV01027551.1~~GHUV01027551.1.p1  ORF type:complete len:296 (+),score=42.30 GHUV01027551.1:156-1043(+)